MAAAAAAAAAADAVGVDVLPGVPLFGLVVEPLVESGAGD